MKISKDVWTIQGVHPNLSYTIKEHIAYEAPTMRDHWFQECQNSTSKSILRQECIPVDAVACCPYLPACTAPGGPAWGGTCPGGVYLPRGCTCLLGCTCPGGCTCLGGTCPGGVPAQGVYPPGCVPAQGGYLPGGLPAQGGIPAQGVGVPAQVPPCGQTDTCKNITFATSFAGGKYVKVHALTSCDSHCMHFWSSIGSGVCTYLHTGQLQEKMYIYIQQATVFLFTTWCSLR